ncbi:MAG: hypothetical protein M3066_08680 [Actinomycetota bacterium]|nr:hypothetical protein [Actinomycetota bacterium]
MKRLLVGSIAGLHRVDDGGTLIGGRAITALAGGWAVVEGRAVWDGQAVVEEMDGPAATCVLPLGDGALVGTAEGHLVRVPGRHRVDSFEHAPDRDRWYTPWGGPPDVRSLAAAPAGAIFASVHVGGILRSPDGGDSWEPTLDPDLDVHQVVAAADGTILAATAFGLATSTDGGRSFSVSDDGLHATYARAVAVAGDTVLLSVSTGPDGRRAAVYRRPLHGHGPFRRTAIGLPGTLPGNIDTFCLVADGDRAALGTVAGRVYASEDAGATWSTIAAGPRVTCLSFS